MKQKKIISTLIIGIMLISVVGAIVPTISADQYHALKGILYIGGTIAGPGIEVKVVFDDAEFSYPTFDFDGEFNFNVGIDGHEEETGDIFVVISGSDLEPDNNKTVEIPDGGEPGIYIDLHITDPGNEPPVANAGGPYAGHPGIPIPFDGSGSTDDGTITNYTWDFGDGIGYGISPTHVYTTIGVYEVTLTVTDDGGLTDTDTTTASITENNPPNKPTLNSPSDGDTVGSETSATLKVDVTDPDGDTMDVSFYNAADDSPIGTDSAVLSGGTASVTWSGLTQGTTYSWYAVADDGEYTNQSDTWSFTTKADTGGNGGNGGNSGNGGNGGGTPNELPTANASAGEPYEGTPGEEITFDGSLSSDPEGTDLDYRWDFDGDGTYDTEWLENATVIHSYDSEGIFTVILQVRDAGVGELTDTYETTATITTPNIPPTAPEVSGETTGMIDTEYTFTAVSTDADNDTISYTFDWGDDSDPITTDFLENGTSTEQTHTWTAAGTYTIAVQAYDNETYSGTTEFTVIIEEEEEPEPEEEEGEDYTALLILLIIIIIIIIGGYAYYLTKKGEAKKQAKKPTKKPTKKGEAKKSTKKKSGKK